MVIAQTRNWPRKLSNAQLEKLMWIRDQILAGVDLHLVETPTLNGLEARKLITMSYCSSNRDESGVVCRDADGKALLKTSMTVRGTETIRKGGIWR